MTKHSFPRTAHDKLAQDIATTHEQWDRGHATILVGSAACLLLLYESGIDASTNSVLMDVTDVDALATERFVIDEAARYSRDPLRNKDFIFKNSDPEHYDAGGFRITGTSPRYTALPFEVFTQYARSIGEVDITRSRKEALVLDSGQLVMPMADIIRWKLTIARPRDLAYCAALLEVLEENEYLLPENQAELSALLAGTQ